MARPERHDADYFPFICKDGKTLSILEGKYQCKGTGFFTNVMRFLTMQPDHHICIEEESDRLYFFARVKCDEADGLDMLNLMAKTGKIHRSLWITHQVIVSPDLISSLKLAYERRSNPIITIAAIELLYPINPPQAEFPGTITHKQVDNCTLKGDNNPQTKLKETKLNKEKLKEKVSGDRNPTDDFPPFPEPEKEKTALEEKNQKPEPGNGKEKSELQELVNQVKVKHPKLAIESWYGQNINVREDAICHVLRSLLKNGDDAEYPYAYLQKALNVEIGKYDARDFAAEERVKKRDRAGGINSMADLVDEFKRAGGGP